MDNQRNYGSFAVQSAIQKRKVASRLLTFLSILCIMALSFLGMKGKHYLLISVLLLAATILPMFLVFEYKKLRAREIVLLATWISFSVLSNEICAHTLPLHIGTMMVVIAGVAMGPEAGFFIGASSRLICNFFDGQGPWTPWQMFALGLLGFISGLVFRKDIRTKTQRALLCLYGALSTFFIYGGIMDSAYVLMAGSEPTLAALLAAYASGLPFNLIFAGATVFFLLVLTRPILNKLRRIKKKYGLLTG